MSIPSDEELLKLHQSLPQQWFMVEQSKIHFFEKFAYGTPKNLAIHSLLVLYFHLSGDVEKCAFYALHGMVDLEDQLIRSSVETACLDFVIYKQGGGAYGSACMPATDDNEFNYTKTRTKTIMQEQRKPFYLLEQLDYSRIKTIVDEIISRSTQESQVSWKVHSKTLKTDELPVMLDEQLEMVFGDVYQHSDAQYRDDMLRALLELYTERRQLKNAVDCLIQLRNVDEISLFLVGLLEKGMYNEALYTGFNVFEEAPQNIVNDAIYKLKQASNSLAEYDAVQIANLIADKVLTGQVSASLYSEFVQKNYSLDKVALRKIMQANNNSTEQLCAYSLMLMLMTLSTGYYEHRGSLIDKQKFYPRLGYYSYIGLVYRGSNQAPKIYNTLMQNFTTSNPYEIGGALFGLALQFAGLNTAEAAPLALIMDINDNQLQTRVYDDRGPIIHGLAFALGFIALGTCDDELVATLIEHFDTPDVDAKFAILIAIGLIQLGNYKYFNTDFVYVYLKDMLSGEHEKLRRGSALCLALLCFKNEQNADEIVTFLLNFAATNPNYFSDSVSQLAPFALGLAYIYTGNIAIAYRLLLLANDLSRSFGAQFAVQAVGFVLYQQQLSEGKLNSILQLMSMCTRSFDPQIRAGSCSVLGYIFACTGHARTVEILCKMMGDQEEIVRAAAYVAQALVLQTINGVELPEAQTTEFSNPVGDRYKNVMYRCDFESDAAFEEAKNYMKLYATPGALQDRYKEIYINKHQQPLSINYYATQFRRDLMAVALDVHDNGKETLLSVRAYMLALGILNCGGLNMSFKQRTDLQLVSYALFLYSWLWYPLMGVLGLCMECDYVSTVQLSGDQIQEMQLVLTIPTTYFDKYGYSALAKDTKHYDVEKYVKKARLSYSDLVNKENPQEAKIIGGYDYILQMKSIAMQEFAQQANNVKLTDALYQNEDYENISDEFRVLETPIRLVDPYVSSSKFIEGTDYEGVFPGVKRGIIVVKEVVYE